MIKLKEIKSVSIDMSTEKTPYNRIYAKPIEKQGDVLLCEFESANYDIEQKEITELKETIEALKSELKEVCDVLIRKCPEMKEWVMLNWRNLYDEDERI